MEIEKYFNDIENKIKANQEFEELVSAFLITKNPSISRPFNRLKKITGNLNPRISGKELKENYYEKQNLEFLDNLVKWFKYVKQQLDSLSADKLDKNAINMDKHNKRLVELTLFKEQLLILWKYAAVLSKQIQYNEFKDYIEGFNESELNNNNNLKIYNQFINSYEEETNNFVNTYFLAETSVINEQNEIVKEINDKYLNFWKRKITLSTTDNWLKNDILWKKAGFLKEIMPLIKEVEIANQNYSQNFPNDNPIKQCERLIKKLKNDNKFKIKQHQLCKKYNVNSNFIKIIDNKLVSEKNQSNILGDLKELQDIKDELKGINSEISSNKWSIAWRKFFAETIGILSCKTNLKKKIGLYSKKNEVLSKEIKKLEEKIKLKEQELLLDHHTNENTSSSLSTIMEEDNSTEIIKSVNSTEQELSTQNPTPVLTPSMSN